SVAAAGRPLTHGSIPGCTRRSRRCYLRSGTSEREAATCEDGSQLAHVPEGGGPDLSRRRVVETLLEGAAVQKCHHPGMTQRPSDRRKLRDCLAQRRESASRQAIRRVRHLPFAASSPLSPLSPPSPPSP